MTLNGITKNVYSDEWYTSQDTVDIAIRLLEPKANAVILCPFDSDKSLFVKTLTGMGHEVIYGIQDFIDGPMRQCDYIITNPPFSIKDKVIKKVYEYAVKTVLILPIDALGGVKRHSLYKTHGYPSVYVPSRRIAYYDGGGRLRKGSSFHSVIMSFNVTHTGIVWERLNNL
jgi:hypothetical protein